jgi:Glycosyl hydrolases family 38 N-terminal domain/Alpha mannosidase middle domain
VKASEAGPVDVSPARLFLVPLTHWDREWYEPFEGFLARLIQMMDHLIELADSDPPLAHFHLDGQSAMIDDYLAVRPERQADIERLAREGRISVGPWFTQMDEFLTSGESMIRNLEWGTARARELGTEPVPAGYLPDQFGHIGQMPQILANAGFDKAVVWRGVPSAIDKTAFWWESPDGSRVLVEYLVFGYGFGGWLYQAENAMELAGYVNKAIEMLAPVSARDRLLVPVGGDHSVPAAKLTPLLNEFNQTAVTPAEISSLAAYLDGPPPQGIPTWRGELRSAARTHILPGVYSARMHQKQARGRIEAFLERVAEPLASLVPGFEWPGKQLRDAWRLLLWNGAHDSVCGCSVDEVARAVDARHERALSIALGITDDAMQALASRMAKPGLVHFNPSSRERHGIPPLGWSVRTDHAPLMRRSVELSVEDGQVLCGGFRLRLVDEGDIGDLYNFCPSHAAPPTSASSYERHEHHVVAGFDRMRVELGAQEIGDGCIHVGVGVENRGVDRRLRLHIGLKEPASGSIALSPFEVVERPIRSEGGTENPSPTWPARGAVSAGGITAIQSGVFEYEVLPDSEELAITLLRCVGTISRPEIATRGWAAGPDIATPAAQMPGHHYVSICLKRGVSPERLSSEWEDITLPGGMAAAPGGGDLPDTGSLLQVEGAELSSVRKVDGRVEVRIWNPSKETREARVAGRSIRLGPARIETIRLD